MIKFAISYKLKLFKISCDLTCYYEKKKLRFFFGWNQARRINRQIKYIA